MRLRRIELNKTNVMERCGNCIFIVKCVRFQCHFGLCRSASQPEPKRKTPILRFLLYGVKSHNNVLSLCFLDQG
jgi:hypothetical protein